MSGFIRRFTTDPGLAEITAIEGVVIIDREPPASIAGVDTGVAIVVAELENGEYDTPTEVTSGTDLLNQFGGFGFTYDGVPGNNPVARARNADGAVQTEYWNGNGFISMVNKKFSRLIVTRVDTSVGEVQFTRNACVTGAQAFTYDLTTGQVLGIDIDGGGEVTATFTGAVATVNSGAGTYPTTFTGGEQMTITVDQNTDQQIGPVSVVFQATDQSQAQVISRINAALGYTAVSDAGGDVTTAVGRVGGTGGNFVINTIDAAVATATGFAAGTTAGTGNVGNIDQVTFAEIKSISEAAITGLRMEQNVSGQLRACSTTTTASGAIEVGASTTATALGFTVGDSSVIADGEAGIIPAGTRVSNGVTTWVTAADVSVVAGNQGPYTARVRPALDDGTALGATTGTVTTVTAPVAFDSFVVTNLLPISVALSEAAIDAAYITALESTLNSNAVSKEGNFIYSARQSNAIRTALRTNALNASAEGLAGRLAVIRPPLGTTTRAQARSTVSQPGVGAYREQRVVYAYPGAATFVPQIAARGLAGGAGFTVDGIIDTGFDSWVVSVMSQLPPEENPGQATGFMTSIRSVERNNPDVQDMRLNDYKAFRASGIAALRIAGGIPVIQSGVTSVDPTVFPNLRNIARRRMADFIQDSVAPRLTAFNKKLNNRLRRALVLGEIEGFLNGLLSVDNQSLQRIDAFSNDGKSGNTAEALALGVFRIITKVRTLSSMDAIVFDTEIGENVITFSEAA
jgi:hypothetical protein